MRIAIFGVGGVGGYIGAQLVRAGSHVSFIARGAHLDCILEKGLTVSSPNGEMLVRPECATADAAEIGPVDLVILGVKAEQVRQVAKQLKPMLTAESVVLPLQNGVEAADQLVEIVGAGQVLAGLCGMMAWVAAPGHIRTLGDVNFVKLGELDNRRSERVLRIAAELDAAGIQAEVPDDIHRAIWEKFLFVASLGGMGALRGQAFAQIRADAESRRMLELSMIEIHTLARMRGVSLDPTLVERTMGFVDELPEDGTSSLQRDIGAGRPSELEAWNGAVVRLAEEAGLDVPVHRFIYESLLPKEQEARCDRGAS